jgi:hypothetical protein
MQSGLQQDCARPQQPPRGAIGGDARVLQDCWPGHLLAINEIVPTRSAGIWEDFNSLRIKQ